MESSSSRATSPLGIHAKSYVGRFTYFVATTGSRAKRNEQWFGSPLFQRALDRVIKFSLRVTMPDDFAILYHEGVWDSANAVLPHVALGGGTRVNRHRL